MVLQESCTSAHETLTHKQHNAGTYLPIYDYVYGNDCTTKQKAKDKKQMTAQ